MPEAAWINPPPEPTPDTPEASGAQHPLASSTLTNCERARTKGEGGGVPGLSEGMGASTPAHVSHVGRLRCSVGVEAVGHNESALATAPPRARSLAGRGASVGRAERKDGVALATSGRPGAVRVDLEQVFRTAYPRVVAVAARVLGSGDEAEDVAQEVFLKFGHSRVPASEAPGWLCVAAAHTALNHLRSRRRRACRDY